MIRKAEISDIPELVRLFKRQHAEMGCAWPIDVSVLLNTFTQAIRSPEWLCLTDDGCLLLAACFESPVGAGRVAQELCLCATPGNFDRMIDLYEQWAAFKRCRSAALGCERRHRAFERLYGRRGYTLSESTFSKVL